MSPREARATSGIELAIESMASRTSAAAVATTSRASDPVVLVSDLDRLVPSERLDGVLVVVSGSSCCDRFASQTPPTGGRGGGALR